MAWTLPDRLRKYADRIPEPTCKALQPAELLARCEYADHLERMAFGPGTDRQLTYGYLDRVAAVLKGMTAAELTSSRTVLEKGLKVAPQGMATSYAAALRDLDRDNPQPPQEYLDRAEAAVTAANRVRPPSAPRNQWRADGSYAVGHSKGAAPDEQQSSWQPPAKTMKHFYSD